MTSRMVRFELELSDDLADELDVILSRAVESACRYLISTPGIVAAEAGIVDAARTALAAS